MAAITDLATASAAGDSDYLVVSQSGTDKKMTRTVLGLTGTGKVVTAGYTLTVPGTGTAALIATAAWTPTLSFEGGNGTGSLVAASSYYRTLTGNGNWCLVQTDLTITKGSGSGALRIGGVPFAPIFNFPMTLKIVGIDVGYGAHGFISSPYCLFKKTVASATYDAITAADMAATAYISFAAEFLYIP